MPVAILAIGWPDISNPSNLIQAWGALINFIATAKKERYEPMMEVLVKARDTNKKTDNLKSSLDVVSPPPKSSQAHILSRVCNHLKS